MAYGEGKWLAVAEVGVPVALFDFRGCREEEDFNPAASIAAFTAARAAEPEPRRSVGDR